jgi:hypothetical protein
LVEPLLFVCLGRRASVGRPALRRAESSAIGAAGRCGRRNLVERGGARREAGGATVARSSSLAIEIYSLGMEGVFGGGDVRGS